MEPQQSLRRRLQVLSKCVCDGARLMVGQGDYTAYAAHIRRTHPDQTPMTELEFFRNRENARFGVGNISGFRCC
ncbi:MULTISPECIES: YbdD/YjiX family protein [unclassified Methylobacterium]|uniref:YbdD/YjiX family protein n=1 Tax=unclassified Methylobacterium TaxID=2615210 RepID=UPI0011C208E4|nr:MULTISPECIES: YbdD/YjiX family protein [unclassified Methylobacterium]QEE41204.1 YbdD/YjiX family protein [Methylobacterium sp. WL1]TXN54016.1 YbdD/YjiX family protein [Methylobacterium sp. WL2]